MKKIVLFIMMCFCIASQAQQLTVKSVNLRTQDARARTNPRDDKKGNKCAIIRVGVVGVEDLVFPDAVGEVERFMSEYVVYVSDGLKKLRFKRNYEKDFSIVDFEEYGVEINSLTSYDVILESSSHLRAAIFINLPLNARLNFDGHPVSINKEGTAMISKPIGEYAYTVEADGYNGKSGYVRLTDDELSTTTNLTLDPLKHKVILRTNPQNASVFVDNVPYDNIEHGIELTEGKHTIRVTAPYYEEKEKTINVKSDMDEFISLKQADQELIKHKEEQSRTSINVRNALYTSISASMLGIQEISKITDKENALDLAFEITKVNHFAGIMGLRFGAGIGFTKSNRNEKYLGLAYNSENDSLEWLMHLDIPLQIGFSLPFGKYKQHMFNVFGGGYGSYIWRSGIREEKVEAESELWKIVEAHEEKDNENKLDYGIRVSTRIDIGHFVIGADLSQSLNSMGFYAGVNLGVKIYLNKVNE